MAHGWQRGDRSQRHFQRQQEPVDVGARVGICREADGQVPAQLILKAALHATRYAADACASDLVDTQSRFCLSLSFYK